MSRIASCLLLIGLMFAHSIACGQQPDGSNPADKFFSEGYALFRTERFEEARLKFVEGLRLAPDNVTAHYLLGETYLELGNAAAADSHFRRVLLLAPTSPEAGKARSRISGTAPADGPAAAAKADSIFNVERRAENAQKTNDFASACRDWKTLADAGSAKGQFETYECMTLGYAPRDQQEATRLLEKSATQGYGPAVNGIQDLGYKYLVFCRTAPPGVDRKFECDAGVKLLTTAANLGNARSQLSLYLWFMDSKSGSYNPEKGIYWLRKAAELNSGGESADAQAQYAAMLASGFNEGGVIVKRDFDQALYWARKAQTGGSKNAEKIISDVERMRGDMARKP
jgi:TPR repeat protein